jgi:hypothetical protein
MRAVQLARHHRRIGTTSRGPQTTSWWSIACILLLAEHVCFQTIVLYWCNYVNGYNINTLRINSFYITFCGQMIHVLCVRACSTFTTVTSGHRIILIPSVNMGIKSASASAFRLESSGTLLWARLLLDRLEAQRYRDFLKTTPPRLLEDVPLTVRHRLWFQHDRAPAYYAEDIWAVV